MSAVIVTQLEMDAIIKNNEAHLNIDNREKEALNGLRLAVKGMQNLKSPLHDEFLIRFLRAKDNNVEEAAKVLQRMFEIKLEYDHTSPIPFSTYRNIYDKKCVTVLKHRDQGVQILHMRASLYSIQEWTIDEFMMALYYMVEEMSFSEETQRNGLKIIVDHADLTIVQATKIVAQFSIKQIRQFVKFFQGSFPVKIKALYGVNLTSAFNCVYSLFKLILKDKLKERIVLSTSGPEFLHQHINPDVLPSSLGGSLSNEDAEDIDLVNSIFKKEKYYRGYQQNYGYI